MAPVLPLPLPPLVLLLFLLPNPNEGEVGLLAVERSCGRMWFCESRSGKRAGARAPAVAVVDACGAAMAPRAWPAWPSISEMPLLLRECRCAWAGPPPRLGPR